MKHLNIACLCRCIVPGPVYPAEVRHRRNPVLLLHPGAPLRRQEHLVHQADAHVRHSDHRGRRYSHTGRRLVDYTSVADPVKPLPDPVLKTLPKLYFGH